MKKLYSILAIPLLAILPFAQGEAMAQGMVLNEFSNGDSGSREYMEFVVIGPDTAPNCGPVDLRGWIIDDNNGDFSCGPCTGAGIATGHLRMGFGATWSAVPTGSIIVIYNDDPGNVNLNMPPADPDDTAPGDGVYIVPASSPLIDVSTGSSCGVGNIPSGGTACPGPCTGNPDYAGACYTAGGAWNNAGLRNDGDAAQARRPDGTYFHGVGYGSGSSGINGGPENIFLGGGGGGNFYMFTNGTSDDYRIVSNWTSFAVSSNLESPGAPNNAANASWISDLGEPCILPVIYAQELSGTAIANSNLLTWATAMEVNADYFVVEKSLDPSQGFMPLGEVKAYGNSTVSRQYEFVDERPAEMTWYRLRQIDRDGGENISKVAAVRNLRDGALTIETWPSPADGSIRYKVAGTGIVSLDLVDLTGRIVAQAMPGENVAEMEGEFDSSALESGMYLLRVRSVQSVSTKRIVCSH